MKPFPHSIAAMITTIAVIGNATWAAQIIVEFDD
jgi:hypothetical protein